MVNRHFSPREYFFIFSHHQTVANLRDWIQYWFNPCPMENGFTICSVSGYIYVYILTIAMEHSHFFPVNIALNGSL